MHTLTKIRTFPLSLNNRIANNFHLFTFFVYVYVLLFIEHSCYEIKVCTEIQSSTALCMKTSETCFFLPKRPLTHLPSLLPPLLWLASPWVAGCVLLWHLLERCRERVFAPVLECTKCSIFRKEKSQILFLILFFFKFKPRHDKSLIFQSQQ